MMEYLDPCDRERKLSATHGVRAETELSQMR